jgi:hypothetical protein
MKLFSNVPVIVAWPWSLCVIPSAQDNVGRWRQLFSTAVLKWASDYNKPPTSDQLPVSRFRRWLASDRGLVISRL